MLQRRTLYLLGAALVVVLAALLAWLLLGGDVGSDDAGSREEPLQMGETADLANGWSVTVQSANTSADEAVAAAEEFNEAPPPGKRYVVVDLVAMNRGTRAEAPQIEISLFGSSGVEYDGGNFVTPPEPRFDTVTELDVGESTAGNLVFVVDTGETQLGLRVQPLIAVDGDQRWIAITD